MNKIDKVKAWAFEAHKNQKYGDNPYTFHLEMVVNNLKRITNDEDVIVAGWLHDSVEDTYLNVEDIRKEFGEKVAELVFAVTGVGNNRKERLLDVLSKIPNVSGSELIKLADRLSNVSSSINEGKTSLTKMYKKEHDEIKVVFPDNILKKELDTLMNNF